MLSREVRVALYQLTANMMGHGILSMSRSGALLVNKKKGKAGDAEILSECARTLTGEELQEVALDPEEVFRVIEISCKDLTAKQVEAETASSVNMLSTGDVYEILDKHFFEDEEGILILREPMEGVPASNLMVGEDVGIATLKVWLSEWRANLKAEGKVDFSASESTLVDGYVQFRKAVKTAERRALLETLTYDSSCVPEADKLWDYLATSFRFTHAEADIAVLKHFIFSVKVRGMFGKQPTFPVVPVLQGSAGCGKSHFAKMISSPLSQFAKALDIDRLLDSRNRSEVFSMSLIGIVDEMSRVSQTGQNVSNQMNALKQLTTATTTNERAMATNSVSYFRNRLSLIATSNFHLLDLLYDASGNRRFYNLPMSVEHGFMPLGNSTDPSWGLGGKNWITIWRAIDENKLGEYVGMHTTPEVFKRMSEQVSRGDVFDWLRQVYSDEDGKFEPTAETKMYKKDKGGLYSHFEMWLEEHNAGKKPVGRYSFYRQLESRLTELLPQELHGLINLNHRAPNGVRCAQLPKLVAEGTEKYQLIDHSDTDGTGVQAPKVQRRVRATVSREGGV